MIHPKYWVPDAAAMQCRGCRRTFSLILRRHHCRHCGEIFCAWCSDRRLWLRPLTAPMMWPFRWCFPLSAAAVCRGRRPCEIEDGFPPRDDVEVERACYHSNTESDTPSSAVEARRGHPSTPTCTPSVHDLGGQRGNKKELFRWRLSQLRTCESASSSEGPTPKPTRGVDPGANDGEREGSRRGSSSPSPEPEKGRGRSALSSSTSFRGWSSAHPHECARVLDDRDAPCDPYASRWVVEAEWYHVRVCRRCFDYLIYEAQRTADLDACEGKTTSTRGLGTGRPPTEAATDGPSGSHPPPLVSIGNLSANNEDIHMESLITLYVQNDPPPSPVTVPPVITRSPNPKGMPSRYASKLRATGPCDASVASQSTRFSESVSSVWNAICSHLSMGGSRSSGSGSGNHTRHLFKGVVLDSCSIASLKTSKSDRLCQEKCCQSNISQPRDSPGPQDALFTEPKNSDETNAEHLPQPSGSEIHQKDGTWGETTITENVNDVITIENVGCPPPSLAFMPRHLTLTPKQRSICVLLFDERACVCCNPPHGGSDRRALLDDPQLMPNGLPKLSLFLARSVRVPFASTASKNNSLLCSLFSEPRRSAFTIRALFEELAEYMMAREAPNPQSNPSSRRNGPNKARARGAHALRREAHAPVAASGPDSPTHAAPFGSLYQRQNLKNAYGSEVDLYNMSGIPKKDIVLVAHPTRGTVEDPGGGTGPTGGLVSPLPQYSQFHPQAQTASQAQAPPSGKPSPVGPSGSSSSAGTTSQSRPSPLSQSRPGLPMSVRLRGLAVGRDAGWPDQLQLPPPSPVFGLAGVLAPTPLCCVNRSAAFGDIGGQLTRMSVDVEGYLVVVLRNSSASREEDEGTPKDHTATARQQRRSFAAEAVHCSPECSSCTSPALTTTSLLTPTYASMVTSTQLQSSAVKSITAHAISGAAGGAPLHTNPPVHGQRAAMEAPAFSGGQLLLLYQRIAACGGRVPPMVVLDVCSALDCDGAESADSGVGGSLRATSAEQQPINEGAVATSGSGATANSPATSILPLFCMRKCLQRFMRNVSHAARQLDVGYVSATYEDHYWGPSSGDSSRISTPYGSNKGEGVVGFTKSQTRRPLLEQPLELVLSRIWARELQALQAERTH